MSCYISSNANRLYSALEVNYGRVPPISSRNRFPAVKLSARQQLEAGNRRDKTGSRTFAGVPPGSRRRTSFQLTTYMTGWLDRTEDPGYGPLFQAALGSSPLLFGGGSAGAGSSPNTLSFAGAHGLTAGQALTHAGEIRFAASIVNATKIQLNAPFSVVPAPGVPIDGTVTYFPTTELKSASIFDYWDPASAVQRILCGAAVDRMSLRINGDYHEFEFSGPAQELIDSSSFTGGLGALDNFPEEPALAQFDYSIIPGHLGQVWLGNTPDRFYSITAASFLLDNDLDVRASEFGSAVPRCISPGKRAVSIDFDLFEQDDEATKALYQAARQQSPIPVMFQLGQQNGQLFGIYLRSVVPEVPEFDDSASRLQWRFRNSRAQGTIDDEIAVAFG